VPPATASPEKNCLIWVIIKRPNGFIQPKYNKI
jgi:hypothetical protein